MKNHRTDTTQPTETTQQIARRALSPAVRTGVKAGLIICRARG